jgi:predicted HAD superfamily Cof-like phosphohydrolase
MNLKNAYEDVKKFHETFEHPIGTLPAAIDPERKVSRTAWMQEELDEFVEGNTVEDEADAMIDLIYFALGTLVEMGIDPQPIFDIVQHANMSKVWPDGLVHKNEMGKTIKPVGWEDPQPKIKAEIQRQIDEAATGRE